MRSDSAGPNGRLQRADVDVEFLRQLVEAQSLVPASVMRDRIAGALQHYSGNDSSPAVPGPKGLERNRQEGGELALSKADRPT